MFAKIVINGLTKAEANAREILEHIEAIKRLQQGATWAGIEVHTEIGEEPPAATDGSTEN